MNIRSLFLQTTPQPPLRERIKKQRFLAALENFEKFKQCVVFCDDASYVWTNFPEHHAKIRRYIDQLLYFPEYIQQMARSTMVWSETITWLANTIFKEHKSRFAEIILKKEELIYTRSDLWNLAITFPSHYSRIISFVDNLTEEHFKDLLYRKILTENVFKLLAKTFPEYTDAFTQPTVDQVIEVMNGIQKLRKSLTEIGKNSKVIACLSNPDLKINPNKNKSLFFKIPQSILIEIAALTGDSTTHSYEQAVKIAGDKFLYRK